MTGPVYAGNGGKPSYNASTTAPATVPSGVANGDLMIAQVWQTPKTAAAPTCAGWTPFASVVGSSHAIYLFSRQASSEPASYTFSSSSATGMSGWIHRVTGAATSGTINVVSTAGDVATGATAITDTAVTTTAANTLVMCCVGHGDGSNAITGYQTGWTGATYTGNSSLAASYISQAAQGSTGTATTTFAGNDDFTGVIFAIAPASAAGAALASNATDVTNAIGTVGGPAYAPVQLDQANADQLYAGAAAGDTTGTPGRLIVMYLKSWAAKLNTMLAQLYGLTSYQQPTAGFSITVAGGITELQLEPAGTLATGTVVFPELPGDRQTLAVASTQAITALTCSAVNGQTINGAPTTLAANSGFRYRFRASNSTWYRLS